jgi:hypothetical protein
MTLAVTGRRLQLRVVAMLQTRDMHLPMPSTVIHPLASSLHQVNLNSTFHLCNHSPILDLQHILLPLRINEVATTTTAGLPTARSRMARTLTMLTFVDSPLRALHRRTATVIILLVFMNILQLGLATDLLWRRQLPVKEHQSLADTAGRERFVARSV